MKIKIRLDIEVCELPVEGNASSIAPDIDRQIAVEIHERLNRDDQWAWCDVIVEARCTMDGETFIGRDTLGACSYKDEEEFKRGDYYKDMKTQAIEDMRRSMVAAVERANAAKQGLRSFSRRHYEIEEES